MQTAQISNATDWIIKTTVGAVSAVFGYFLPIKDLVHLVILFFVLDMLFGYWAARRLRGERFSTKIVWNTTILRMLISILLIIMAFLWDTICKQDYLPTYNIIGWFIAGILIFSISKNGYKITKWRGFFDVSSLFTKKIEDQTGIKIDEMEAKNG